MENFKLFLDVIEVILLTSIVVLLIRNMRDKK